MAAKMQWWIMLALWGVVVAGGGAWAHSTHARITTIERDQVHPREWGQLMSRLGKIEEKIDRLAEKK